MSRRPACLTLQTLEDRGTPAAAGTLDPAFGVGGVVELASPSSPSRFTPTSAITAADGRIVVAGALERTDTSGATSVVVRYTADGRLDLTFGRAGVVTLGDIFPPRIFATDPAGQIYIAGVWTTPGLSVRRLTSDGRIDATFGVDGQGSVLTSVDPSRTTPASAVSVQADGRIVLVGADGVGRLTADGQPDASFGTGGGVRVSFPVDAFDAFTANAVAVFPDGRIAVAGRAKVGTAFDIHYALNYDLTGVVVALLTPAGQLDPTFGEGGRASVSGAGSEANRVRALPDGGLLVTGRQTGRSVGNETTSAAFALRLNGTGQLDSSYGTGGRFRQVDVID